MTVQSKTGFAKRLSYSTAVVALLAVGPHTAQAQDEAQTAQLDLEQIVVTGTRIQREGFEAPTPVSVLGIAELQNMATSNIIDAVNRLPTLGATVTTTNSSAADMTGGIQNLNLRGLTPTRTLVLLDGKRVVGSTLAGFDNNGSAVDVNVFPNALIARVDIVTGGASAVYGSDALAGVVNFVLDKEYTGVKGELLGGITTYGDGEEFKVSMTAGTPFGGGRGHFLISGESSYQHGIGTRPTLTQKEIALKGRAERSWFQDAFYTFSNPNYDGVNGQPRWLTRHGAGLSIATRGGLILNTALRGTQFGKGGEPLPFNFGHTIGGLVMEGGDWEASRIDMDPMLQTRLTRANVFTRASYDVTENVNVFAEFMWAHTKSHSLTGVPQFNLGNITIQSGNPFIPDSVQAQMTAQGISSFVMGTNNIDMDQFGARNVRHLRRYVLGAAGQFDGGGTTWDWEAYWQRSTTHASVRIPGDQISGRYQEAVDAVVDPLTGQTVCRSTLTNPGNACKPYNPMGMGVNTDIALDYVAPQNASYGLIALYQNVFEVTATGEAFDSWAGPISVAFGGAYRDERVGGVSSALDQARAFFAGNFTENRGKYDVVEGFVETVIPVANNTDWARSMEFNAAVRATKYSTSGYVTTWKVGATYSPIDDITFRATQSRDIRAPTLGDLFNAGRSGTGSVNDPENNNAPITIVTRIQGNKDLGPERANSTGIGVVLQPSWLPGFGASVDYFDIDVKGAIASVSSQSIVDRCFGGETFLCSFIERDANNLITFVAVQPANLRSQSERGFDIEASYNFPLSDIYSDWNGDVTVRGLATYITSLKTTDATGLTIQGAGVNADSGLFNVDEGLFAPHLRYLVSATYSNDPLTATLTARGVGSGKLNNEAIGCASGCPASTAEHPTIETNSVKGVTYFDLSASYKILDGNAELFMVADNIFNTGPASIPGCTNNAWYNGQCNGDFYDRIGRLYRAGIRFDM